MKNIIILGATASGKSSLAIALAKRLKTEIISCDSMQVYRGLDIGTAKLLPAEQEGIVHHLIDIKDPDQSFSVAEFSTLAQDTITSLNAKSLPAILCGGTGLFAKGLINGHTYAQTNSDPKLREELNRQASEEGNASLYARLEKIDSLSASKIHPNDTKRIIRALEIFLLAKETKTAQNAKDIQKPHSFVVFELSLDREALYNRINQRVDIMIKKGLLEEVKSLKKYANYQSMQAIGYKQIIEHLEGKYSLQYAVDKIKQFSRNYAKRQLTFFRHMENIIRLDASVEADKNIDIIMEELCKRN